ncbi:MAG: CcmD family protein [Gemmatimonadaceae bacterium]
MSSEWSFVIAAYAITWVVLVGYAAYLARRRRRAARRVAEAAEA